MLAVSGRAYPAAITVLEAAQKMAKGKFISHLYTFGKLILRVIANLGPMCSDCAKKKSITFVQKSIFIGVPFDD